jgi:hypothetical protein
MFKLNKLTQAVTVGTTLLIGSTLGYTAVLKEVTVTAQKARAEPAGLGYISQRLQW